MKSLMDQYSKEEFEKIILSCSSYTECLKELGYNSYSGASIQRLKDKIKECQIDTSHFTSKPSLVREEKNIFIKDSTACQKVLRNWYKKGNYSDYVCSICGQEPFWNGKELTLILDHINGYNKDDRLENLRWVCPNCNQQLDTTNGKNKNHKEHKINLCIDCGTPISNRAIRCSSCNYKAHTSEDVPYISREELKNLIRSTPFTTIGKQFGVSDNAVRKWCKKYNLPDKSKIIKTYSDEDWLKI